MMAVDFKRPLDGAIYMAQRGYKVFPLRENDKRPAFEGWQDFATTDINKLREWGLANPTANWGVYAGGSGLCIVDIDKKPDRDGEAAFMNLEAANGALPSTLTVRTPSGGKHIYLIGNAKNTVDQLGVGIDTRGLGGYVVAPGSTLLDPDGNDLKYTIESDAPVVPAPGWLTVKLSDSQKPALERPEDSAVENSITQGGRDNELTRWAGVLRGQGLTVEEMYASLSVMNEKRCNPPLPEADVRRIAESIGKKPRGEASAFVDFMPPTEEENKSHTFWASEIDTSKVQPTDWIVKGRFARKFLTVTLAPGGVGKTRVAMSEALAVTTGIKGLLPGGLEVRQTGAAWYYSTEDPRCALEERMAGMLHRFRLRPQDVRFAVTSGTQLPLVLVSRDNGQYAINTAMIQHIIATIKANNIALFVVDPLVKSHLIDENDNTGMDKVAQALTRIADVAYWAVHLVHHTRKMQEKNVKNFRGDMDVSRGASAVVSAARIAHTLTHYNRDLDGDSYQASESEAWSWVRLDDAKDNLAPRSHRAWWWHLESVRLPCHTDPEDSVGVAVAKEPGRFDDDVKAALIDGMLHLLGGYLDSRHLDEIKLTELVGAVKNHQLFAPARTLDGFIGADTALTRIKALLIDMLTLERTLGVETYSITTKSGSDVVVRKRPHDFLC